MNHECPTESIEPSLNAGEPKPTFAPPVQDREEVKTNSIVLDRAMNLTVYGLDPDIYRRRLGMPCDIRKGGLGNAVKAVSRGGANRTPSAHFIVM